MKFDPEEIKKAAKQDFEAEWNKGKELINKPLPNEQYPHTSITFGKAHPVYDTIARLREA